MPGGRKGPLSRTLRDLATVRRGLPRVSSGEAARLAERISRREFLRRSALGAAGVALTACTSRGTDRPSPPRGEPRIVVVGAGLAGLSAAYWLHRAGVAAHVIEAQARAGGRCWSSRELGGRLVAEHGGEFIDTRHVHVRRLVTELGLRLDDLWTTETAPAHAVTYVGDHVVGHRELFVELDGVIGRLVGIAAANGSYFAGQASPAAKAFDRVTMAEWLDRHLPGGLGSELGRVLSAEQTAWWGLDPESLPATALVDFFAVSYPGDDERYTVHGGNDQIVDGLLDELPRGTVELEAPVRSLRRRVDGSHELGIEGRTDPVVADHVILTLPFTALRDIDLEGSGLSELKRRAIRELGMGTNAKVLLRLADPFPIGGWDGSLLRGDAPSFQTWESGSSDEGRSAGLLTVYSGGRLGAAYTAPAAHGPAPPTVVRETIAALDAAVPGVATTFTGDVWLDHWASDPWVRGSYAAFLPGQLTSFWGELGRAEGGIHLAGEHTSEYSQGYLDGGVESGGRAAMEILDAMGRTVPPALAATARNAERFRPRYPWS